MFVESKSPFSHQGVTVLVEGNVSLSLNSKNVGAVEAMVNKSKQIPIVFNKVDLLKPGKLVIVCYLLDIFLNLYFCK